MTHRIRSLAVAACGILCALMVTPSTAQAYSCNINRPADPYTSGHYAITSNAVSGVSGVASSILQHDPFYTAHNTTGTNVTVMLANLAATKWAQFGWFKMVVNGSIIRKSGLQYWVTGPNSYFQWFATEPTGVGIWYQVQYETSSMVYDFYYGPSKIHIWSASQYGSFVPGQYQIFGETHDWADQMPGGTGKHVTLNNSNYWTGANHTAHLVTTPINTEQYYGVSNPSTSNYQIWDKSCSS